jgi:hypothetical protein
MSVILRSPDLIGATKYLLLLRHEQQILRGVYREQSEILRSAQNDSESAQNDKQRDQGDTQGRIRHTEDTTE